MLSQLLIKLMQRLLLTSILILGVSCSKTAVLGEKGNPVKLYFTPSVDSETISKNSDVFIRYLEKETGLYFKSGIPSNYIAVVEAFGSKRADIGVMNSFGYLLARKKYGAEAKLKVIRNGLDHYFGQIIAHVDSGIKTVKDIQGKKFAFTDSSSTSGYMFPLKVLRENNVEPGNTVFAIKHDNVVTMVYQGQVDAGATFHSPPDENGKIRDARDRVRTQFPDVEEKVKLIQVTDPIPNDPFVFRKDLPVEITNKFIAAVKKFLNTDEGKNIFKNIYAVDGLVDATDSDYDILRKMIETIQLDTEKLVK
jgi:phosphonate transport system substrate-binding protein